MIYKMNETDKKAAIRAAGRMTTAARRAPKAFQAAHIETLTLDGADLRALSAALRDLGRNTGQISFAQDAETAESCRCAVLIGVNAHSYGLNCGLCGAGDCADAEKNGITCTFAVNDLGMAAGSAAAAVTGRHMESRVLFTAGLAALRLKLFPEGVNMILGVGLMAKENKYTLYGSKTKMRKAAAALMTSLMIVFNTTTFFSAGNSSNSNISVKLNGAEISFPDVQPYLDSSNRTQVPIRFVSEALEAEVDWDSATQTDIITKGDTEIKIVVGDPYILVNDQKVEMDTYARLENDRLFVPLRYICDALGAEVVWDDATKTVEITSDGAETPAANVPAAAETPAVSVPAAADTQVLPAGVSTVSIVRSDTDRAENITQSEIEDMVNTALQQTNFSQIVKNGQTIVIKPNLSQMEISGTNELLDRQVNGVTTDWRVTEAVMKQARLLNPDGKIYVLEGSADGDTKSIMDYYHYTKEYIPEADGFLSMESDNGDWHDYNSPLIVKAELPDGRLHQEYYFNKILYNADVVISIPCLKTSSGGVVVTGSVKNVSIGACPGNIYNMSQTNNTKFDMVSHAMVDGDLGNWIFDYFQCKPVTFAVADALQGFQNGPVAMNDGQQQNNRMNMRLIMASSDPVALDTACSYIMGWDPASIDYLEHFKEQGKWAADAAHIYIDGADVDTVRKPFSIKQPELGGSAIQDLTPPVFDTEVTKTSGGYQVTVTAADDDAVKAEVYTDRLIKYGIIQNKTYAFSVDSSVKQIKIDIYDAFLNKSEKVIDLS